MDWKMYELRIASYLRIKAGNPGKNSLEYFAQKINP